MSALLFGLIQQTTVAQNVENNKTGPQNAVRAIPISKILEGADKPIEERDFSFIKGKGLREKVKNEAYLRGLRIIYQNSLRHEQEIGENNMQQKREPFDPKQRLF